MRSCATARAGGVAGDPAGEPAGSGSKRKLRPDGGQSCRRPRMNSPTQAAGLQIVCKPAGAFYRRWFKQVFDEPGSTPPRRRAGCSGQPGSGASAPPDGT